MSNRMISDGSEMQKRWDLLVSDMKEQDIDCLFLYSTDRLFSGYLHYVADCPTIMYPLSGLFSEKGISLVGHGVKGTPLYPLPPEQMKKGVYQFHSGGVRQHEFIRDLIGVPSCPTTSYAGDMWPKTIGELIRKYDYKKIGLVGRTIIPMYFIEYFHEKMPDLELVDATDLVDRRKQCKSPYELQQARGTVQIIDELLMAAPAVMKVGQNLREVGRKMRALADGYDCMDVNIMLGKHPSMPMFCDWPFTDEDVIGPEDCIELMVEVSGPTGVWGEAARIYSMGEPPEKLEKTVQLAFEMQDYLAGLVVPGADPSEIFAKYNEKLVENGFPAEKRFCCHGQGFDVVEVPFIRPENHEPIRKDAFIAAHPSMYDQENKVGCFVCDNFLVTEEGTVRLNQTPREIIRVHNWVRGK